MSVPVKYRAIGDFHEYYSGARRAPYLTLFIGGNHEASSHLMELYYGGWVAPNIYYLGAANVVNFGGLRIAGLSGIWKGRDYNKPHRERLPYGYDAIKSIYHVREWDVRKLLQIKTQVDVGISHDWPNGVEWMGDWKRLFKKKDLFEADARNGTLGSQAARFVLDRLRPPWWFSAHMHCKFAAVVSHERDGEKLKGQVDSGQEGTREALKIGTSNPNEIPLGVDGNEEAVELAAPVKNEAEIDLDMDDDEEKIVPYASKEFEPQAAAQPALGLIPEDIRAQLPASFSKPQKRQALQPPPAIKNKTTNFLALDKCLPHREFLQILDVEPVKPVSHSQSTDLNAPQLSYDTEWLAITRVFAAEGDPTTNLPRDKGEAHYAPLIAAEEEWVKQNIVQKGRMTIPQNFEQTAPVYDPATYGPALNEQSKEYTNPQTVAFCVLLHIPNHFDASEEEREERRRIGQAQESGGRGGRAGGRGGGRGQMRGGFGGFGGGGGRAGGRGRGRGSREFSRGS